MEEHIGLFSGVVSSFLEDLSRSDRFYMEREKYNHTSVSSATGLLIAYNRWLNEFTGAVRDATQKENHCDYVFLVTCGGRDQTETFALGQKSRTGRETQHRLPAGAGRSGSGDS